MLSLIKGCRISDPSILHEGYIRTQSGYSANVDAGKIQNILESFVRLHNEFCFIILEVPTNMKEESAPELDGAQHFHKDIYYLDGLTANSDLYSFSTNEN